MSSDEVEVGIEMSKRGDAGEGVDGTDESDDTGGG